VRVIRGDIMAAPLKSNAIIVSQPLEITVEVSHNEPLHPDLMVCSRMMEVGLSNCKHGCKIYKDPWSNYTVLAHNSSYGCTK
jgi:hypothetical protein